MRIIEILLCTATAIGLSFIASWTVHLKIDRNKNKV